jgi:heme/copper-type cytochrome/quinol oxidase subunit 2
MVQGVCAAAVFLSGAGTVLGFSSVIAASAAGPATGVHANRFRIPMLAIAGVAAVVNLVLLWNAERIRRNPSARWRMRPLTRNERVEIWIQVSASVFTLLLIVAELISHPLFHREL